MSPSFCLLQASLLGVAFVVFGCAVQGLPTHSTFASPDALRVVTARRLHDGWRLKLKPVLHHKQTSQAVSELVVYDQSQSCRGKPIGRVKPPWVLHLTANKARRALDIISVSHGRRSLPKTYHLPPWSPPPAPPAPPQFAHQVDNTLLLRWTNQGYASTTQMVIWRENVPYSLAPAAAGNWADKKPSKGITYRLQLRGPDFESDWSESAQFRGSDTQQNRIINNFDTKRPQ